MVGGEAGAEEIAQGKKEQGHGTAWILWEHQVAGIRVFEAMDIIPAGKPEPRSYIPWYRVLS